MISLINKNIIEFHEEDYTGYLVVRLEQARLKAES